jgi:glycosyltransferase involved in cell wall biosynthesis
MNNHRTVSVALIFFSDIPWKSLHQRPQHLAALIAEEQALLWVEPATLGRTASFSPVPIAANLHGLSLPFLPYNARNRFIRSASRLFGRIAPLRSLLVRIQERILRRALRTLDRGDFRPVCIVQNFQSLPLLDRLRPGLLLYDCIDYPFGFAHYPGHVHREWHDILERADVLVATSPTLQQRMQSEVARPVQVLSNGVEYARFATPAPARPVDLAAHGQPIVGYVGSVYPWLDFPLLEFVCREARDLRIVLIGHDHPATRGALARLSAFPNFSFLGIRPYDSVPLYLHAFDVGIIPFLRSPLTEGVNPVKLYEYSAAGLPTVATDFSTDLEAFRPMIAVCSTRAEFLASLRAAIPLRHDPRHVEHLQSFARSNDWRDKGREILRLVREHPSHPPTIAEP